jgi:hypothetical protein
MMKPGSEVGLFVAARSTSSSDWLNCCERSLAGGEAVFVAKLGRASSWYLPKLPMTGRSLARLARKSQKMTRGSGSSYPPRFVAMDSHASPRNRTAQSPRFSTPRSSWTPSSSKLAVGGGRAISFAAQRAARFRRGKLRKMACPLACGAFHGGSRPSTRAEGRGSLVAAPFNRDFVCCSQTGGKWTPRPYGPLFGSPPCRCSAQPSPGLWITLFSPRSSQEDYA